MVFEKEKQEIRQVIQDSLESYALADDQFRETKLWRYAKKMLNIREGLVDYILELKIPE